MVQMETLQSVLKSLGDLYLRPDDRILFVLAGDYGKAPVESWFLRFPLRIVRIPTVLRPGQDYELDDKILEKMTVGFLLSNISISHSPSTGKMVKAGMFIISCPDITPDWVEILHPEHREGCQKSGKAILDAIGGNVGGIINITHPDGTNLWLDVPAGNWEDEVGERKGVGTNGLFGEEMTAPFNANGFFVLGPNDFATNPINRVVGNIRLTINDNKVVKIDGGEQADQLLGMLTDAQNPLAFNLGEFAIGLHFGVRLNDDIQRSVVAEKAAGGTHIAIGTNSMCLKPDCPELTSFKHGRYNAGVHADCIKYGTTVTFYGRKGRTVVIIRNGVLQF